MKRISSVFYSAFLLMALALSGGAAAQAVSIVRPLQAEVLTTAGPTSPPTDALWQQINLPHRTVQPSTWYRIVFDAPVDSADSWAVYLPYFYGGGQLLLNGTPLGRVAESNTNYGVRWERPFLLTIPDALLKPGSNILLVRMGLETVTQRARMPLLVIGPQQQLLAEYESRLFKVRTMPQFTVVACFVVGTLVLFIWWRQREELLYGLFGIAALLWGVRTLTFVVEILPMAWWGYWRLLYHSATGGFIIILTVFALRLAGGRHPRLERALLFFWLLGPLGYIASVGSETLTGRLWSGGMIPIGLGMLMMSIHAAWRQRTVTMVALSAGIALAVAAGVHDYLLAESAPSLQTFAPQWVAQRIFLLHYAADLLLLVMGTILSARFIGTLQALEQLNRTLESRVALREQALADNYARLGRLERQHAADEERQRIMRDLHDGLGSQLFVTLSRVEANEIEQDGIAEALRDCIADMRLTLDAMSPDSNDFLEAWGNFRFRWERQLDAAAVQSNWKIETADDVVELSPHSGLQLLRIAQEALTNVLKHATAHRVQILLSAGGGILRFEATDDGQGMPVANGIGGRGLTNMRTRALRLGARMGIEAASPGTRVWIELDHPPVGTAATRMWVEYTPPHSA